MADSADIVIRVRTDGVANSEAALKRLEAQGIKVERISNTLENSFARTANSAEAFHRAVGLVNTVMTVTSIVAYLGVITKLSDAWVDMTNKLANANSAHENMAVVQSRVFDLAQRTRTSLEATSTLYARMERSLSQYGVTGAQVAQITETINKSMIVSGATTAEATAAIIQFSQGLQSGVLRGDEFRSVMEQAPRLGKMIADGLGVGTKGLREMANAGKLTSDVVIKAISEAASTIDEEFARTMPTFAQQWTVATNNVQKFMGTTESMKGIVGTAGQVVQTLSENLDVLSNVALAVAAVFTGKLLTSIGTQIAAYAQLNKIHAQSSAVVIGTVDALTRESVARYNAAQATLAQAAAERQQIQAALAANQQYYKGIGTLNALMQNTRQVRIATEAVAVATTAMAERQATAATATKVLTAALGTMRGVVGVLGGPMGMIMLAVAGWYAYSQSAKQAVTDSQNLAMSQEDLTARLKELTLEQQRGLAVQYQRAEITLADKLRDERTELAELRNQYYNANQAVENSTEGTWAYNNAVEARTRIGQDLALKEAEISKLEQDSAQIKSNLASVNDNLRMAVMGLTGAVQQQNVALTLNNQAAANRSPELVKAIAAESAEMEIATMKLKGQTRQAAQLQDAQQKLGKAYQANEKFIKSYINGTLGIGETWDNEKLGIKEFLDMSGKAYDSQKALQDKIKNDRNSIRDAKAAARYEAQWDKAYERVEARGATGIQRLQLQQEAEIRLMKDKAEKAKATEEELGAALDAINKKYARLRADEAGKYKPGAQMVREWQEAQQEIKELQQAGLLTEQQANNARLNLASEYYKKRSEMQSLNPFATSKDAFDSEMAALEAQYNTAKEMAQGQADQLLAIEENYQIRKKELQTKFGAEQLAAQNQTTMNYIQGMSTMAGAMTDILAAAGDKSSAAYKTMFALSKAFAIAQATLNLTSAISQAMADPSALTPAQKFANMAAIAAAGGALVSSIASATLTGMAHDGISNVPQEGTWLLQKGERVLSPQQNADFTNFLRGGNYGAGGTGGSNVTINQTLVMNGNGDKALTEMARQASRQGAEEGYNKVLSDFSSRGQISRIAGR